jgi:hypothetical protein
MKNITNKKEKNKKRRKVKQKEGELSRTIIRLKCILEILSDPLSQVTGKPSPAFGEVQA